MFPNTKFVLYFVDSVFQPIAEDAVKLVDRGLFDLVYNNKMGVISVLGLFTVCLQTLDT